MNSPLTEFDEEEYAKMLREEGYKEGYEEIRKGVMGIVKICKSYGLSKLETVKKLKEELNISKEQIEEYVEAYWES
ncbi:MAG: hypothetical protein IJN54_11640 [Lachnospiraceae bacterium]|nr:hypothetical protein [Lachnospiraceae bacterium]